jgi:hypothetical protein
LFALGGAACLLPSVAHGQRADDGKSDPQIVWQGQGLRYAGCLQFLVSPDKTGDLLDSDWRPLRADADSTLPPALRHTIEGEPQYAGWTPGQVCVMRFNGMSPAGHAQAGKQPSEGQLVVLVAIAGTSRDDPQPMMQATSVQTSDWRLAEASRSYRLRLEDTDARFSQFSETSGERLTLRIKGATLAWDGLAPVAAAAGSSDSGSAAGTDSPGPVTWHWSLAGPQNAHWSLTCRLVPAARRPYSGAVSVSGKSDLAKALRASPILFVGPLYTGGAGEFGFQR